MAASVSRNARCSRSSCVDTKCEGTIHTFEYVSDRSLESTVLREADSAGEQGDVKVVFCSVPPHVIDRLSSDERHRHYRLRFFDRKQQTIVITMVSTYHETATLIAEELWMRALKRAAVESSMRPWRSARAPYQLRTDRGKEPDASYQLRRSYRVPQYDFDHWPQVVIETAYSESKRDILKDVRWWLENGGGAIRFVIIARIKAAQRQFNLNVWMRAPDGSGFACCQGGIAARIDSEGGFQWLADSSDITLPFADLFCRDPIALTGEADLELLGSDLLEISPELTEELFAAETLRRPRRAPPPPSHAAVGTTISIEDMPKDDTPETSD
ncbi:hypothetical protein KEM56_002207 [Ascosphaera pollenicola]|nr:hypothetical protein KEM56_002207 [Ascosphaera pollenicola]